MNLRLERFLIGWMLKIRYFWAKLQNTPQLISASLTCVGRLWRSRHNTIDAILIQWHVNELRGILKLLLFLIGMSSTLKHSNISKCILHTVLYKFLIVLTRRLCLRNKCLLGFDCKTNFPFQYLGNCVESSRGQWWPKWKTSLGIKTQNFLVKYSQSTDKSVTPPLALMVVSSQSV